MRPARQHVPERRKRQQQRYAQRPDGQRGSRPPLRLLKRRDYA